LHRVRTPFGEFTLQAEAIMPEKGRFGCGDAKSGYDPAGRVAG